MWVKQVISLLYDKKTHQKKRICTEKIISFGANCVNDNCLDVEIDTPEFEISDVFSVEIIKKRKEKENG